MCACARLTPAGRGSTQQLVRARVPEELMPLARTLAVPLLGGGHDEEDEVEDEGPTKGQDESRAMMKMAMAMAEVRRMLWEEGDGRRTRVEGDGMASLAAHLPA